MTVRIPPFYVPEMFGDPIHACMERCIRIRSEGIEEPERRRVLDQRHKPTAIDFLNEDIPQMVIYHVFYHLKTRCWILATK